MAVTLVGRVKLEHCCVFLTVRLRRRHLKMSEETSSI